MKKMMAILFIIVFFVSILVIIENYNDKKNENFYQNEMNVSEFNEMLKTEDELTVYFYQTDCMYCKNTTPILVPLAKKLKIDLKVFNLQENEIGWNLYSVEGTPTIVYYKNGKEISRIAGQQEEDVFKEWLESTKLH